MLEIMYAYRDMREKVRTAARLRAMVKQWAGIINEMQYYTPERKEAETIKILNEIMNEAIRIEWE